MYNNCGCACAYSVYGYIGRQQGNNVGIDKGEYGSYNNCSDHSVQADGSSDSGSHREADRSAYSARHRTGRNGRPDRAAYSGSHSAAADRGCHGGNSRNDGCRIIKVLKRGIDRNGL